jgi:hypothetical protein
MALARFGCGTAMMPRLAFDNGLLSERIVMLGMRATLGLTSSLRYSSFAIPPTCKFAEPRTWRPVPRAGFTSSCTPWLPLRETDFAGLSVLVGEVLHEASRFRL